jgi:hypothetical protein
MIPKDAVTAWRAKAPWRLDAQVEANLAQKRLQPDFRDDVSPLLSPGFRWDFETAMDTVLDSLVASLPGRPWKDEAFAEQMRAMAADPDVQSEITAIDRGLSDAEADGLDHDE